MDIEQVLKTKKGPRKPYKKRTSKEKNLIKRLRIAAYASPPEVFKMYDEIFNEVFGRVRS